MGQMWPLDRSIIIPQYGNTVAPSVCLFCFWKYPEMGHWQYLVADCSKRWQLYMWSSCCAGQCDIWSLAVYGHALGWKQIWSQRVEENFQCWHDNVHVYICILQWHPLGDVCRSVTAISNVAISPRMARNVAQVLDVLPYAELFLAAWYLSWNVGAKRH